MSDVVLLIVLLVAELVFRLFVEIRERRITQLRGGAFAVLRLIPLVNDIVPLPESRKAPAESDFVKAHEFGHRDLHHSVLRNLVKIVFLILALWFFTFMLNRCGQPLLLAVLWLHLAAIPFRIFFHWYCWTQEYEADHYAFKQVGRQKTKEAMRNLVECEIVYSRFFALMYREHPTALMRRIKLLGK